MVRTIQQAEKLGTAGTLLLSIRHIFAQVRSPIVVVRVEPKQTAVAQITTLLGSKSAQTGAYAFLRSVESPPKILIAPSYLGVRHGIVSDISITGAGSSYTSVPTISFSGGGGAGATATAEVKSGKITKITITNAGYGYTSTPTIALSGGGGSGAALTATVTNKGNAITSALLDVARTLRGVVVSDSPNTTIADALRHAADFTSDRLFVVDPYASVLTGDGQTSNAPISPFVAGLIAKTDAALGFWHSPSNQEIMGIVGTSRVIGFDPQSPSSEANQLNAGNVATIIYRGGYRLWGNQTTGTDSRWQFLAVRRTADAIYDAIEAGQYWAVDKPFSANLIYDIGENLNEYLRRLKTQGAILGGTAKIDPEANNGEALQRGHLVVDFDFEPGAPVERITFRAVRNKGYYTEIL